MRHENLLIGVQFMPRTFASLLFTIIFVALVPFAQAQAPHTDQLEDLEKVKALMDSGRIDESIEALSKLIESNPTPLTYYYRGMALSLKGFHGLAIKDYSEAIKGDPGKSAYFARRGISRLSLGDYAEAYRI